MALEICTRCHPQRRARLRLDGAGAARDRARSRGAFRVPLAALAGGWRQMLLMVESGRDPDAAGAQRGVARFVTRLLLAVAALVAAPAHATGDITVNVVRRGEAIEV